MGFAQAPRGLADPATALIERGPDQVPTRPPPRFVMVSTAGRGGMAGSKSGQRVEGFLSLIHI